MNVTIQQVLIPANVTGAEAIAIGVLRQAQAGRNFDHLIAEFSARNEDIEELMRMLGVDPGGPRRRLDEPITLVPGEPTPSDFPEPVAERAIKLPVGGLALVETGMGFHVVKRIG